MYRLALTHLFNMSRFACGDARILQRLATLERFVAGETVVFGAPLTLESTPTVSAWYPSWIDWTQEAFMTSIDNITAAIANGGANAPRIYIGFMAPESAGGDSAGATAINFPDISGNPTSGITSDWIAAAKAKYPSLTFVISLGGWSYSTVDPAIPGSKNYFADFEGFTSDQWATWATNAWADANSLGCAGIDIDYEVQDFPWTSSSILTLMGTALAEHIPADPAPSQKLSVTVPGDATKVIDAVSPLNGPSLRILNLMVYDSGPPTKYDPRAAAAAFEKTFASSKLGFGLELTIQAAAEGKYVMDPEVGASYTSYALEQGYADVFVWDYDPVNVAPVMFAFFLSFITSTLSTAPVPGVCPSAGPGKLCTLTFGGPTTIPSTLQGSSLRWSASSSRKMPLHAIPSP